MCPRTPQERIGEEIVEVLAPQLMEEIVKFREASNSRVFVFVSLSGDLVFSMFQSFVRTVFDKKRFMSSHPSSQREPQTYDDVRTERAAIALSGGFSGPLVKRQRSAGRPTFQETRERAVQEQILQFHELPNGAYPIRAVWWRPGQPIVRPLTADVIANVSTLFVAVCDEFVRSTKSNHA